MIPAACSRAETHGHAAERQLGDKPGARRHGVSPQDSIFMQYCIRIQAVGDAPVRQPDARLPGASRMILRSE